MWAIIHYVVYSVCRIQEVMDGDLREADRVPRTMDAELTADLG